MNIGIGPELLHKQAKRVVHAGHFPSELGRFIITHFGEITVHTVANCGLRVPAEARADHAWFGLIYLLVFLLLFSDAVEFLDHPLFVFFFKELGEVEVDVLVLH